MSNIRALPRWEVAGGRVDFTSDPTRNKWAAARLYSSFDGDEDESIPTRMEHQT